MLWSVYMRASSSLDFDNDIRSQFTIGARGSDDPILKKMERHFCETAMEQFDLGATGFTQVLDVIRAGTCLGAYMYWTAQVHKVNAHETQLYI